MHTCLFYLNDSISPPIYSSSATLPNNRKIKILPNCQPAQSVYSIQLKKNKEKNAIPYSTNKKCSQDSYIKKGSSSESPCLPFSKNASSKPALEEESYDENISLTTQFPFSDLSSQESYKDNDMILQKDEWTRQLKKPINKSESQQNDSLEYSEESFSGIESSSVSSSFILSHFSDSLSIEMNNRNFLKKGDQIKIFYDSKLVGIGTFYSGGTRFFIWRDLEGNECFQVKHRLLTIKKL